MYLQMTRAAKLLNMSRQWLYELIKRGEIGTSEIDGRPFVLDDDRFKAIRRQRENGKKKAA